MGYNPNMTHSHPTEHPAIAAAIRAASSQAALASRVGCAQQHISKLLQRQVKVTAEMALRIAAASDGAVSLSDLRPDLWPRVPSPEAGEAA